jgi:3-oxoacyl-[acyl-carrier protein] reductase
LRRAISEALRPRPEAGELGSRTIALQADVTQKKAVENMVGEVCKCFGKIDLLVNNAGMNIRGPLEQVAEEDWDKVVAVNLKAYSCAALQSRGNDPSEDGETSSILRCLAHRCYAENGAFGPSKAAVINLTKQMAVEWANTKYGSMRSAQGRR